MIKQYLHKALTLPPHVTIKKAAARVKRMAVETYLRQKDKKVSSYTSIYPKGDIYSYFPQFSRERFLDNAEPIISVINHYIDRRFDLLGSGWVRVYHGMKCRGLEGFQYNMGQTVNIDEHGEWLADRINTSNLAESQRIWKLVDPGYTPIDWHIDFKSGYRWSVKKWYRDIKYGHKLGVDIKVPWELARMQHLPQMALYYQTLPPNSGERNLLAREFRNQTLDFIATNPPRFGVNWFCAMDVAIRAANWLMAYNIFISGGSQFDDDFEEVFTRSIYEHGLHIVSNLEWDGQQRGNHYLADIAGLAFIAASLSYTEETDAWLAFAVQELITEVNHQFYPDGCNFEGSTAYHRLSAEKVYYATALILGLPQERLEKLKQYKHKALKTGWGKPKLQPAPLPFYSLPEGSKSKIKQSPFPDWYFERMERMAEFIMDITKPNGHIPQIGDNDSGRFFKLMPKYEQMTVSQAREMYANLKGYTELPDDADYFMEDYLDCSQLVAAAYGMFKRNDFADWLGGKEKASRMADCSAIQSLSSSATIGSQRFFQRQKEDNDLFNIGTKEAFQKVLSEMQAKPKEQVCITEFPAPKGDLRQGITLRAYPDFGLYLCTSGRLYLAIRCWPGRKPFQTGHMHNDQLSVELVIDDKEMVSDPGSYIYTPLPDIRNRYRSFSAHFTLLAYLRVPNRFSPNLFTLQVPVKSQIIYFNPKCLIGKIMHECQAMRWIDIQQKAIVITDFANASFKGLREKLQPSYSKGYGLREEI